jgi:hypothetical protein
MVIHRVVEAQLQLGSRYRKLSSLKNQKQAKNGLAIESHLAGEIPVNSTRRCLLIVRKTVACGIRVEITVSILLTRWSQMSIVVSVQAVSAKQFVQKKQLRKISHVMGERHGNSAVVGRQPRTVRKQIVLVVGVASLIGKITAVKRTIVHKRWVFKNRKSIDSEHSLISTTAQTVMTCAVHVIVRSPE